MSGFFGLNVKPILDLGHGAVDCNSIPCLEYQRGTRVSSLMWQSQVHLDAMQSCQAWGRGDAVGPGKFLRPGCMIPISLIMGKCGF